MERSIVFTCGHKRAVQLPDVMAEEAATSLALFLSRTLCLRCRAVHRAQIVNQLQESLGLLPLKAPDPRQQALAEQVRLVVLLQSLPQQGHPCSDHVLLSLRTLIHARLDAAFWIERRAILWERERLPFVLADLHQEATLHTLQQKVLS